MVGVRRPSLALALVQRARAAADCAAEMEMAAEAETKAHAERWRRRAKHVAANPARTRLMAKRKAAAPKQKRRPRAEIDRNYFLGDVFIKTGVAVVFAIILIALYSPGFLRQSWDTHHYTYPILLGSFAAVGALAYLAGRHLRHAATQWEAD